MLTSLLSLSRSNTLDFWSKFFPLLAASAYIGGLLLLNAADYSVWGFTDFSISNVACVTAACLAALVAGTAYFFSALFNWYCDRVFVRKKRWAQWTFGMAATFFLFLDSLSWWGQAPLKHFLKHHSLQLSHTAGLVIFLSLLSAGCFLILTLPITWIRESLDKQANAGRPAGPVKRYLFRSFKIVSCLIGLGSMLPPFTIAYLLIPARFGGGAPEPLLVWVAPESLPVLGVVGGDQQPVCLNSAVAIVKGLSLVHETSDSFVLTPENSNEILFVSKDLVRRRQQVSRTPSAGLELIERQGVGHTILCIPAAAAQAPPKV